MLRRTPLTAAILALSISAYGCGGGGETPKPLGRPIPATSSSPRRQGSAETTSSAAPPRSRRLQAPDNPAWLVDPDRRLPPASRWWSVLAVARRFAAANAAYQTTRVSSHVRVAIADTCTPSFAHLILRNAPVLPRGLDASGLSERVEAIQPLAKLSRGALVLVHVTRTIGGRQGAGTLELTLADVHGRWRVSAFAVLS